MIRIEAGQVFPVAVRDGFDYITDPAQLDDYWPRAVAVDPATRWQQPGDRARVVLRMLGRRVALDMTLARIEPYRLVEYTSEQKGLPRSATPATSTGGRRVGLPDRRRVRPAARMAERGRPAVVRRATERAVRETIANLDQRFR